MRIRIHNTAKNTKLGTRDNFCNNLTLFEVNKFCSLSQFGLEIPFWLPGGKIFLFVFFQSIHWRVVKMLLNCREPSSGKIAMTRKFLSSSLRVWRLLLRDTRWLWPRRSSPPPAYAFSTEYISSWCLRPACERLADSVLPAVSWLFSSLACQRLAELNLPPPWKWLPVLAQADGELKLFYAKLFLKHTQINLYFINIYQDCWE